MNPVVGGGWSPLGFDEHVQYWKEQLHAVSVLELPPDRPRPLETSSTIAEHAFDVPQDVAARLAALVGQDGLCLVDLTVAAFQVVLARSTGQEDLVVAVPAPGRGHPVLVRSRVTDSISFMEFL